jgi:hypothetical protein
MGAAESWRLSVHLDHASWVEDQVGPVARRSDAPVSADLRQLHSGGREQAGRHISGEREPEWVDDGRLGRPSDDHDGWVLISLD